MVQKNCANWTGEQNSEMSTITVLTESGGIYTNYSHGYDKILSEFPEYNISLALYYYLLPCIIVLGTVSNVLAFIVMTSRNMRNNSTCFLLAALAIFDTLVLYTSGGRYWVGKVSGLDIKMINDPMCKLFGGFLYNFVRHVSVWIVVAVTVDRFMLITFPVKTRRIPPRKRAAIILSIILGVMFTIDVTTLWSYEIIEDCVFKNGDLTQRATQVRCYTSVLRQVWPWLDMCLYSFIPITLLLFLNVRLMVALLKREKTKQITLKYTDKNSNDPLQEESSASSVAHSDKPLTGPKTPKKKKCQDKKAFFSRMSAHHKAAQNTNVHFTTVLPLIVSISFIVCATPITVIEIVYARNHEMEAGETAKVRLIRTIFFMLMYLNHSVNLFLYCVAGTTFRSELVSVFKGCCKRRYI